MPTQEEVLNRLKQVIDPELHRDIVSLGMVKELQVEDSNVIVTLELTTPACPLREELEKAVRDALLSLPDVNNVYLKTTASVRGIRTPSPNDVLPQVKNVIAVASGKGGVGKSTVAVNLTVALAKSGAQVGILDADIYGPNIPLMMGVMTKPMGSKGKVIPPLSYGAKVMSLGFFYQDDTPLIWRGPLVASAIRQFLTDVEWGELDYLIVDLPPGTGDAPLTLTQTIPLTGVVVVTTPQDVALGIATKALQMFRRLNVTVFGIIENMSYFICPHCQKRTEIFGHGGGRKASERLGAPFLGEIPLDPQLRIKSDEGKPIVLSEPTSPVAQAFTHIAKNLAGQVSIAAIKGSSDLPVIK